MTIKNEVKELSRNLARLGLEQILVETLADKSFRVVYVNKKVQQRADRPIQLPKQTDNSTAS